MAKWDHEDLKDPRGRVDYRTGEPLVETQGNLFDTVPRLKEPVKKKVPYKYHEDQILHEIAEYIDNTYSGHYVGEDNVQSLDLILATGHATGFNIGNILKYGSRFGKKRGFNRDDLLKVIHYAIFELYNQSTKTTE